MIEQSVSLASNGVVKVPGYEQLVRFGYTKNRGVYYLAVTASGEWEGLAIRCFWHVPDGKDPASTLVKDGSVAVPASVTAQPGNGCITFEGSDGTRTVTSADLRYRVSANSGTEDGSLPEPGTPAWQELVWAVHTDATAAEQAKTDAQTAAQQAGAAAQKAGQALSDTMDAKEDALVAIGTAQATATQAVDAARVEALKQVETSTEAAQTAASEAATSAGNADQSAQAAAGSLQELKNGIASGDFKGEPGTSPTVTVQDITGGHRIVITDATGTSSVDVLDGKQGDPGKPGDTGATPELTIGTVEEGDAPSATITGTAKNPVLNLTLKSGAPGKDATVDGTLTQSGKAADAKVTGDELARKAVIDDTTVGTDAWSAKHIVDMLCPPLEETGNPVQCYPVENYPLGVTASWEPVQAGSGEPSPDNVRPIKGRDSVTAERCGENVIEFLSTNDSNSGIKIAVDAEKNITLNGTVVMKSNITIGMCRLHWVAGKNYTMYAKKVGGSASLGSGDGITFAYSLFTQDYNRYFRGDTRSTNLNAYIASDAALAETELVFMLQCWRANTVFNNFKFQIEVVPGTTAPTTYAPYTGQTATLTLPRTIYGGTVDAVTGEGQETWKIATIDAKKIKFSSDGNDRFWNLPYHTADGATGASKIICSHFISSTFSVNEPYAFFFTQPNRLQNLFSSVDELNDYCAAQYAAGTPVQIVYQSLKEPVPFTATGAQPIPALPGVNTIMTDADSVMVTGRADPIKRITDLEDAVASMTDT